MPNLTISWLLSRPVVAVVRKKLIPKCSKGTPPKLTNWHGSWDILFWPNFFGVEPICKRVATVAGASVQSWYFDIVGRPNFHLPQPLEDHDEWNQGSNWPTVESCHILQRHPRVSGRYNDCTCRAWQSSRCHKQSKSNSHPHLPVEGPCFVAQLVPLLPVPFQLQVALGCYIDYNDPGVENSHCHKLHIPNCHWCLLLAFVRLVGHMAWGWHSGCKYHEIGSSRCHMLRKTSFHPNRPLEGHVLMDAEIQSSALAKHNLSKKRDVFFSCVCVRATCKHFFSHQKKQVTQPNSTNTKLN